MVIFNDNSAYNGNWSNGKMHGDGYLWVVDNKKESGFRIRKGIWDQDKHKQW